MSTMEQDHYNKDSIPTVTLRSEWSKNLALMEK